jgi:hypothetical protein
VDSDTESESVTTKHVKGKRKPNLMRAMAPFAEVENMPQLELVESSGDLIIGDSVLLMRALEVSN